MFNKLATAYFRWLGGEPCFRIYGKARQETRWREIEVHASARCSATSRWPRFLFRGTCITWTSHIIAVGWDFAAAVLREQMAEPASRDHPVEVVGGRLRNPFQRADAGGQPWASASEVLAHECGHTAQAHRMQFFYLPIGATFTLFREGPHWWNRFENQASEQGQFGGIVNDSVHPELMSRISKRLEND
jgi:hypothetical protein